MKKYIPYILVITLGFGAGFFFKYDPKKPLNGPKTDPNMQESSGEVNHCEPKIVYKEVVKPVVLPIKPRVGCNVDWDKREVMLYAPLGYHVKCWVNYETQYFKESIEDKRSKSIRRPQSKLR